MFILLTILAIIAAILLILVVSMQSSKKEGLGESWGTAGASQLIGIKKTTDLLEQITWGLLMILLTLSLTTAVFLKKSHQGMLLSPNLSRIQERNLLAAPSQQEDTTASAEADAQSSKSE